MIVRVALPVPLHRLFDYHLSDIQPNTAITPGVRVRVSFANRELIGLVVETAETSEFPLNKLKPVTEVLDDTPVLSPLLLNWGRWCARYYAYPEGDALLQMLPTLLKQGKEAQFANATLWRATPNATSAKLSSTAHKQRELLDELIQHPLGISREALNAEGLNTTLLKTLNEKGLAESFENQPIKKAPQTTAALRCAPLQLNDNQQQALQQIMDQSGFAAHLLYGVTGSGKTEVYLQAIAHALEQGKQVLVLVPEISLTPQTIKRFRERFSVDIETLHSNLTDRQRLDVWLKSRLGQARVIIGTRSAIFTPLAHPGLIIIDEEHDSSFKQQDGYRYHARDIAMVRAQKEQIPVVLGSATPSLETLHNAYSGRYSLLKLPNRAGHAQKPRFELLDIRHETLASGLSQPLIQRMHDHLGRGMQVLLFLNRRGFSPSLTCNDCGGIIDCTRCDAHMTLHRSPPHMHCHHCDRQTPIPRSCMHCGSSNLQPTGIGTERVEDTLAEHFPDTPVLRVDRDTTSRKNALNEIMAQVHTGEPCILLGTQILAKGHHFPKVTLVSILDADTGLFSADFRGMEKTSQLIIQVAGRAGRADNPGEVLLQTRHAEHPMLHTLISEDYLVFAANELAQRQRASLPPYSYQMLLRAEASRQGWAEAYLQQIRQQLQHSGLCQYITLTGPFPAVMEKRAGMVRAYLLFTAPKRSLLQQLIPHLIELLEGDGSGQRIRWALDVDPIDHF